MIIRTLTAVLVAAAAIFCLQAGAFAANSNGNGIGIFELYMTADANDFFARDSFHEDELPWLYMKVRDSVEQVTGDWWFWNKGGEQRDFLLGFDTANLDPLKWDMVTSDNTDNTKNLWLRRLDITEYTAHDQWWHINQVKAYGPNGGKHEAKYHVTPEPVSSILFLMGAGTLAYATRKRKKA